MVSAAEYAAQTSVEFCCLLKKVSKLLQVIAASSIASPAAQVTRQPDVLAPRNTRRNSPLSAASGIAAKYTRLGITPMARSDCGASKSTVRMPPSSITPMTSSISILGGSRQRHNA